jgi:hypothetical protein
MDNVDAEWREYTGNRDDESIVKAMQKRLPVAFRKERQIGDPVFNKMPWPIYRQYLKIYFVTYMEPDNQEELDIIMVHTLPLVEAMRDIEEWFGWKTMKVIMEDLTAAAVTEEVEESKEEMESEKGETEVQERDRWQRYNQERWDNASRSWQASTWTGWGRKAEAESWDTSVSPDSLEAELKLKQQRARLLEIQYEKEGDTRCGRVRLQS